MALEIETEYGRRIMFLKEAEGFVCKGSDPPYPIYTQSKSVALNLCDFPRNATDKADLAQFPTSSSAVGSEDPREGASRVPKYQRTLREWKIKELPLF